MQYSNTVNHFKNRERLAEIFSEMFGDFINLSEKRIPVSSKLDDDPRYSYNGIESVHSPLTDKGADMK